MNTTGVTRYISELVRALPRVDGSHRYSLLINRRVPESLLPTAHGAGSCVERRVTRFPIVGTQSRILWEQAVQPLEVAFRGFDVIHHTDRSMPWLPTGIPSVCTIHDISYTSFPETYTRGKVVYNEITARIAAVRADRIITASENTKREIMRYLRVPQDKIRVVYDAADVMFQPIVSTEDLEATRQRFGLPHNIILYVGSLNPRKNVVTLVRGYAELKRISDLPHKLVLAGPSDWKSDPLFRTIQQLGLESEIALLGQVTDLELAHLYNLADLFVFPSLHEGFGLPPLEAMACGTPVVCADSGSLPEIVGNAALVVEPTDVEGLTRAMERVLTDPKLASRLGGMGLERARMFSWEQTARETLAVYEEIARRA
jgi:glycosyltransferase involved in cell wall biosynthesis